MSRPLRVKVELNKGRRGISTRKLPKLIQEIGQFLEMLSEDVNITGQSGEWIAVDFHNSSLVYTNEKADPVELPKSREFKAALRSVVGNTPDSRLRRATLVQYSRIAEPMDSEEEVHLAIEEDETKEQLEVDSPPTEEWLTINKHDALTVGRDAAARVRAVAGIQGVVHSIFFGSAPPHFNLRELSTGELIKCTYNHKRHYQEIADALQRAGAVLHVYGTTTTDLVDRNLMVMSVDRIIPADPMMPEEFEKFFGCAPRILGDLTLQEWIDKTRGREQ